MKILSNWTNIRRFHVPQLNGDPFSCAGIFFFFLKSNEAKISLLINFISNNKWKCQCWTHLTYAISIYRKCDVPETVPKLWWTYLKNEFPKGSKENPWSVDSKYRWRTSQKTDVRRWEEKRRRSKKKSKIIAYLKVKVKIVKEKMQCFVK